MLLPFNKFQFILLTEVNKHENEEINWFGVWAHETLNDVITNEKTESCTTHIELNEAKAFEVFDSGQMKWNHFVYDGYVVNDDGHVIT